MNYRFEDYFLDIDRRELRRGSRRVITSPQVFDLLEYLVRNRHRIVTKNDLLADIWDGRVVSDSTLSSRLTAVRQTIGDSGKHQRLIRTVARRGFRFVGAVEGGLDSKRQRAESPEGKPDDAYETQPYKPAIAVLPFVIISQDDSGQEEFANGLTEDIASALSHFSWLSVAARSLSCIYRGWAVDIKRVGRDLSVQYVLEGSVRKVDDRLRITATLVDARNGKNIWTNRFDTKLENPLILQDRISLSVVNAIGPRMEQVEIERARRSQDEQPSPLQRYLLGVGSLYKWSRNGIDDALRLFNESIQIDPEFAPAYGMAAYCYVQRKSYGWVTDRQQENLECAYLARKAAEFGKSDAIAMSKAAHAIASVSGDVDSGSVFVEHALKLNPNLAGGWYVSGWIKLFRGDSKTALEHLERALSLVEFDPLKFKVQAALAYAHFLTGRFDDASVMAADAIRTRPNYLTAVRGAAASHALAGRVGEAQKCIAQMRERDPALRISGLSELIPFQRTEDFAMWAEALQKAGLPE